MAEKNYFEVLNSINVNDKIEKKNGLSYLSWAYAWGEFCKHCPSATYEIVKFDGLPYVFNEKTGFMVYTRVTAFDITREMWLPVMDSANFAMFDRPYEVQTKYKKTTVQAATMFDINKAIMRCLTKNLAMFGLGLYIYAGEDLPDEETTTAPKTERPLTQEELLFLSQRYTGDNLEKLLDYYKIGDISEIDPKVARNLINQIKAKAKKGGS